MRSRLTANCQATLYNLPDNLSLLNQTAIFRVVQQILNTLPIEQLSQFYLEVIRTGQHLCLKGKFKLGAFIYNLKQVNLLMDKLFEALKHILYMFNGNIAFQYFSNHEVEIMVYLNEVKLI